MNGSCMKQKPPSILFNAIQQGILMRSTKARLEELEATRDDLKNRIACEKLVKPKISAEFMTFWLHRFRKLDVKQKSHRKMLIDAFINAIFLYDDKMVITFNYKEGTQTIIFDDLKQALEEQSSGSDLDCFGAPNQNNPNLLLIGETIGLFFFIPKSPKCRYDGKKKCLLSATVYQKWPRERPFLTDCGMLP